MENNELAQQAVKLIKQKENTTNENELKFIQSKLDNLVIDLNKEDLKDKLLLKDLLNDSFVVNQTALALDDYILNAIKTHTEMDENEFYSNFVSSHIFLHSPLLRNIELNDKLVNQKVLFNEKQLNLFLDKCVRSRNNPFYLSEKNYKVVKFTDLSYEDMSKFKNPQISDILMRAHQF